jgi:hypothetical protein
MKNMEPELPPSAPAPILPGEVKKEEVIQIAEKAKPQFQMPTNEKGSNALVYLGLFLAIVLIFGFLGWKYVFGEKLMSSFFPTPTPTMQVAVTPTLNPISTNSAEMANWKTYKNEKWGYEVKYPPSWYLYEPSLGNSDIKDTIGFWVEKTEGEARGVWVMVHNDKIQFSNLNDWWEKYKKLASVNFKAEDHNVSNFQIDGSDAIKDETRSTYPSRPYMAVYVLKNEEIYDLNTNIMVSGQIDYPLFSQILSTFRFVEKSPSVSVAPVATESATQSATQK